MQLLDQEIRDSLIFVRFKRGAMNLTFVFYIAIRSQDFQFYTNVISRFVPMDVSYSDDSYPVSDVSYPTFGWFVPNSLVDSYPTNYDTKCLKQT